MEKSKLRNAGKRPLTTAIFKQNYPNKTPQISKKQVVKLKSKLLPRVSLPFMKCWNYIYRIEDRRRGNRGNNWRRGPARHGAATMVTHRRQPRFSTRVVDLFGLTTFNPTWNGSLPVGQTPVWDRVTRVRVGLCLLASIVGELHGRESLTTVDESRVLLTIFRQLSG